MSEDRQGPAKPTATPQKVARCPICARPRVQRYRPFCSARCRDVDLARWFGEVYSVPAVEPGDEDDEDGPDEAKSDR